MQSLGALSAESDLGPVRRSVQYMLNNYLAQSLDSHEAVSMAVINDDLYELSQDQPFRFPASFTFVLRSLVALEALGKMLDPEFNLMAAAEPLSDELMPQGSSWTDQWGQRVVQVTQTSLDLPQRVNQILDSVEQNALVLRMQADEITQPLLETSQRRLSVNFIILAACFLAAGLELILANWMVPGEVFLGVSGLTAIAWIKTIRI